jgi:signal transduction histidine kinase
VSAVDDSAFSPADQAVANERKRLAREIHDGIAQDLVQVGYALDDIGRDCEAEVAKRVVVVREQIQAIVADLRATIFNLRSGVNDSVGLGTALSEHAHFIAEQSGLVVHVSIQESPQRLPPAVEAEVLRIVLEAITNVRKHAKASNLRLSITVEPPNALIRVTDDGCGLGPARLDSFGIHGMYERARRIGAHLRVGPGPVGPGTRVELALGDYSS